MSEATNPSNTPNAAGIIPPATSPGVAPSTAAAPPPAEITPTRRAKAGDLIHFTHVYHGFVEARIDRVVDAKKGLVDLTSFDERSPGLRITSSPYDPSGKAQDSWRFADSDAAA